MLPEEEAKIAKMMETLDAMEIPDLPEYLRAENIAPAISRGLTHAEHKAEWEANHGPVDSANA